MDAFEYSSVLVKLDAGEGVVQYITNSPIPVTHGGSDYTPTPSLAISPTASTGDLSTGEYRLSGIPHRGTIIPKLAVNAPFQQIAVSVTEVFYDMLDVPVHVDLLFKGYIAEVTSTRFRKLMELTLKDHKYYTDTTAGIACTELCAAPYFADGKYCTASLTTEAHTVASIDGVNLTILTALSHTTPYLFNHGFISFGAERIKIQNHTAGLVFQMARTVPLDWDGQAIVISSGCDKQLATCASVHGKEDRFMGMGIAMVSYNPMFEGAS